MVLVNMPLLVLALLVLLMLPMPVLMQVMAVMQGLKTWARLALQSLGSQLGLSAA